MAADDDEKALRTFQRKAVPLLELYDEFGREESCRERTEARYGLSRADNEREHEWAPLIVMASLVHKLPNLGGLARTAEIFGAQKLVLHDRRLIKHEQFRNVAVTAEKWVPIEEVSSLLSLFSP